jgi:dipeptidyl aminopeptidase/acylaminoacyl peptidase
MPPIVRAYGIWDSPISPSGIAGDKRLDGVAFGRMAQRVWLEGRSGRGVLCAMDRRAPRDVDATISVRAEVGYGGGDFTVHGDVTYFIVQKTGRIYRQSLSGGSARPITPRQGYAAAPTVSPCGKWVAYVHHDDEGNDRLAIVDAEGKHWPSILAEGHDFYMQPAWSPDSKKLCWIAWDHPQMPWDGTVLEMADVVADENALPRLKEPQVVAGGTEIAIFQPQFSVDGKSLFYVSDETGWGRIAQRALADGATRWWTPEGQEFGYPAWVQGQRTYAFFDEGKQIVAVQNDRGVSQLVVIQIPSGETSPLQHATEFTDIQYLTTGLTVSREHVALCIASNATNPARVMEFELSPVGTRTRIIARSSAESTPQDCLASCEPITWKTANGEVAHGLYYAPKNDRFVGIGKPPLVALIHGGPTSQARAAWSAQVQFLTSRGYAVLQVNYRGSTGYGRAYMLKLRGNWGVCDVEDSVSGAQHLANEGLVDPARMVIMGGSAGGFTVLQTMIDHPTVFAAGVSLYGVANQFDLASDTHKFESRYTDSLIGPLPEASALYRARSPVFHASKIQRPMLIFQGEIDNVVPKKQSDDIVAALQRNGVPHEYHLYASEGHGWRKSETIEHFYRTLDAFLKKYVIFS